MTTAATSAPTFGSSLRQRISIAVVGITSVVVAIAAVAIWMSTQAFLISSVDRELTNFSQRIRKEDSERRFRRPTIIGMGQSHGRVSQRSESRFFFELTDATGHTVVRSPSLAEDQTLAEIGASTSTPLSLTLADGRMVRAVAIPIINYRIEPKKNSPEAPPKDGPQNASPRPDGPRGDGPRGDGNRDNTDKDKDKDKEPKIPDQPAPPSGENPSGTAPDYVPVSPMVARFGIDVTRIYEELSRTAVLLSIMWLAATTLAWAAVLVLRTTILRPLNRLSAALDSLGPNDLTARLPTDAGPDEVRGIVLRLNDLLDRLYQAFTREQVTIANIAHELRTPVAALRSDMEFRLMVATDPAERTILTTCMSTIGHMQTQVSNLLLLARLESGKEPLHSADCDLVSLITDSVERLQSAAARRDQTITTTLPTSLIGHTSADHLRLVLDNLLGNAVAHGLPHQAINVTLMTTADSIQLRITNPFAGTLNTDELGKPYYRGDGARHDTAHCGLGLALCLRLSRLLDSRLQFTTADQHFVSTLTLPASIHPR